MKLQSIVVQMLIVVIVLTQLPTLTAKSITIGGRQYTPLKLAKHDQYNFEITIGLTQQGKQQKNQVPKVGQIDILFALRNEKNYYRLIVDAKSVQISAVEEGNKRSIAARQGNFLQDANTQLILIKRRKHALYAIVNNVIILHVFDSTFHKGGLFLNSGISNGLKLKANSVKYTPVEDIHFSDDFMRTEDETKNLGRWQLGAKAEQSEWKLYSVLDRIRANPDARIREGFEPDAQRSPNPFCLSGKARKGTIITTGYDFWDDYRAGVSAKTDGGKFGLIVAYQNPNDYYLLRWELTSPAQRPGKVELVKMTRKGEKIIGEKYVLGRTDNWYRLELEIIGGRIRAFIDKTLLFDVPSNKCLVGQIGLYSAGGDMSFFDDVLVESCEEILFDSPPTFTMNGNPIAGQWKVVGKTGATEVVSQPTSSPSEANLYALGDAKWHSYVFEAAVRPSADAKELGLAFGVNTTNDYWLFRIVKGTQADAANYELTRRKNDKLESIAKAKGIFPPASVKQTPSLHLTIDLTENGIAKFYIDDVLELRCRNQNLEKAIGKVGLYAVGSATFNTLLWRRSPTNRDWERHVGREIFEHDPYMQGWASPRWAWIPLSKTKGANLPQSGTLYMHKGDFYGAFDISLPVQNRLSLFFGCETTDPAEAYAVNIALNEKKKLCTVSLKRANKLIASKSAAVSLKEVTFPPDESDLQRVEKKLSWGKVIVRREGKYIIVAVNNDELISFRDDAPLWGRRVGLVSAGELDLSEIDVRRDHVRDYLFERAPVEWTKVGTWEVTNRFACDPRWSHLNGRSFGIAALWNKHEFQGDFTLEYYAGMRMRQGKFRGAANTSYPRVGDINVSFCNDGKDIFSGYNLIIAAWDPLWSERFSKIYRREKVVQQTDEELIPRTRDHSPVARVIPLDWDPGGRPVHGAWYYIKLRRIGKKLEFYFDNELVMTYNDPQPLSGTKLALWTQANSIVIARAKICYERISHSMAEVLSPKAKHQAKKVELQGPPLKIRSTTHTSCYFDFENSLCGWTPANGEQSAFLSLDTTTKSAGHASLKLTNIYPGGDFGAKIPIPKINLSRITDFSFDYNIPPNVKVNLYISLESEPYNQYFIQLTGSDFSNDEMLRIGKINVVQDGKWHRATFDIEGAMKSLYPMRKDLVIESMRIGNFHEGYLNAGLGGNKAGAYYHIDNFQLITAGPNAAEFECDADNKIVEYRWVIDQQVITSPLSPPQGVAVKTTAAVEQTTKPAKETEQKKTRYVAKIKSDNLNQGIWYLHVVGKKADGKWTEPQHYPFRVCAPLTVTKITPPTGAKWGGNPITIEFSNSTPADLVVPSIKLIAAGKSVPINDQIVRYQLKSKLLTLDLRHANAAFLNGQPIEFALNYSDNINQNSPTTATYKWSYVMDYGLDKLPPSKVKVSGRLIDDDFEEGSGQWTPYNGIHGATLVRDSATAASGQYSLKLINRIVGGSSGAVIYPGLFNIGQYPIVTFDYKTDGHLRADLYTKTGSYQRGVTFTDNDTNLSIVGAVPGVQTDNKWHHAEFNWKKMFDSVSGPYNRTHYRASQLILADFGHTANSPGVTCHIDNFSLVPALSDARGIEISWTAHDPSGIAGYSYSWSAKPDEVPDTTSEGTENKRKFSNLPEGNIYFHIRAQDGAGNWGTTSHYRYIIDNTPPKVVKTKPAAGEASAASTVEVTFNDSGTGIDPASFSLTMNGKKCTLNKNYATFLSPAPGVAQAGSAIFTFDWVRAQRYMSAPINNGSSMTFAMQPVKDFVGNASQPITWTWTIDYSKDKVGPSAPRIFCSTHKLLMFDSFTDDIGRWISYGRTGATLELYLDNQRKDYCLKLTNEHKRSSFGAYVHRGGFDPEIYPMVCFEYKIPPGLSLMFIVYTNRRWYAIKLTKESSIFENIGEVPGIIADGKWHAAVFNLDEILKKALPNVEKRTVSYIVIGDWSKYNNPLGAAYYLDNFCIMGEGEPQPIMRWMAVDSTGISGYSYAIDANPRGEPDTKPEGNEWSYVPVQIIDKQGLWYLHLRASDGAGNWGMTAHYPYYCVDVPPTVKGEGMEAEAGWTVSGTNKRDRVSIELPDTVSKQNKIMRVKYFCRRKQASFTLSRSVHIDLTGKKEIALNLYNTSSEDITISLRVATAPPIALYTSQPQTIPANSWKSLRFPLSGNIFRSKATGQKYTAAIANVQNTRQISFVVSSSQRRGYLLVDDVKVR